MARTLEKLNSRDLELYSKAGRYADGGNLYLSISATGAKSWLLIYRFGGKQREMGLGPLRDVSLQTARSRAAAAREHLAHDRDPMVERERARRAAEKANVPSFGQCADDYVLAMSPAWRNAKHAAQWSMTLKEYAKPLRAKPVDSVTTADVVAALTPIWNTKPETASRVRGRIEAVLDRAKVLGHRTGENPAAWRGNLQHVLPARKKETRGNHEAMPYAKVPEFMRSLSEQRGNAALALRFTILTAARTAETLGARWEEFDEALTTWTVPSSRMKSGREHRVPLSPQVADIVRALRTLRSDRHGGFVFGGNVAGKPMSNMVMLMLVRRMSVDVTAHGFRSSFRGWCSECTSSSDSVAEMALAHVVSSKVEAAYRRGDLFDKRRHLMNAWADYCLPPLA